MIRLQAAQDRDRRITSRDNPFFKELLQLAGSSKERKRREASLIEGLHLCEAFLEQGGNPRETIATDDAFEHPQAAQLLARCARPPILLSASLFKAISGVEKGVGLAMLVDTPRPELPERLDEDAVFLDRLQDPGNVGTILRTCAGVGIRRIITAPGTAWCWSPKVLRAGMGAHFHLQIHESVGWDELRPRLALEIRATAAGASAPLWELDLRAPGIWLLGQEGGGLSQQLLEAADRRVSVPQSSAIESFNVGVAAALCLYEQLRQRSALPQR